MSDAPVELALRLRRRAVEAARQALAGCLAEAAAAADAVAAARDAIAEQHAAADALDASDGMVEAFIAWLPIGRRAAQVAAARRDAAELATAQARIGLTIARSAEETAEALLAQRRAARATAAEHRARLAADDAALRSWRAREP